MSFEPPPYDDPQDVTAGNSLRLENAFCQLAESSIVGMIIDGSGGPENGEITDQGLRFIRHLMASSRSCNSGFLPNLKDMDCIRELARDYINQCGTPTVALQSMYKVI